MSQNCQFTILFTLDQKSVKLVIKKLTRSQVRVISGIIFNAVQNRLKLKRTDINRFKKFNSSWKQIVKKSTSLSKKRQLFAKRWKEITIIIKEALKWITVKT